MSKEKASSSSSKMISLKSCDGFIFEVEASIVMKMQMLMNLIDGFDDIVTIPLPNVLGEHLAMIIEYCKYQEEAAIVTKEAKEKFEVDFVNGMSNVTLKHLIRAADYLDINSLFNFLTQVLADRIQDMGDDDED
ncbi:SKP1-like protein 1A [Trifolium pratense]|uniref:SKP1-like protein 1A n=1 Tax=Trifolium pratense TaxID=57577 RepID=UPI001E696566|nr:SKP1-like protein 1A [Trifolium pratense]